MDDPNLLRVVDEAVKLSITISEFWELSVTVIFMEAVLIAPSLRVTVTVIT